MRESGATAEVIVISLHSDSYYSLVVTASALFDLSLSLSETAPSNHNPSALSPDLRLAYSDRNHACDHPFSPPANRSIIASSLPSKVVP